MKDNALQDLAIEKNRFQKKPLRIEVYDFLEEAITEGRLKPGHKLNEIDLGNHLGISRTPIREALLHLEKEGLVSIDPGKGAVVAEISRCDVEEIYPIVAVLEGLAARAAALNLNSRDIVQLKKLNKQLKKIAQRGDASRYMDVNSQFHQLFLDKCSSQRWRDLISSYRGQISRFRLFSLHLPHRMKESIKEHDAIIEAFEEQDGKLAERLVRVHVEKGGHSLEKISEPKGGKNED